MIKHPKVQCQLTIISSKKLPARDAINLVLPRVGPWRGSRRSRTRQSIYLVPRGAGTQIDARSHGWRPARIFPRGRQRIVKFFPLKNIAPAELKEKVRGVLSEKATVEVDERGQSNRRHRLHGQRPLAGGTGERVRCRLGGRRDD